MKFEDLFHTFNQFCDSYKVAESEVKAEKELQEQRKKNRELQAKLKAGLGTKKSAPNNTSFTTQRSDNREEETKVPSPTSKYTRRISDASNDDDAAI